MRGLVGSSGRSWQRHHEGVTLANVRRDVSPGDHPYLVALEIELDLSAQAVGALLRCGRQDHLGAMHAHCLPHAPAPGLACAFNCGRSSQADLCLPRNTDQAIRPAPIRLAPQAISAGIIGLPKHP